MDSEAHASNGTEPQKRVAVVSGASRGLGRATALELAKTGLHVIITGRNIGALEELDDEIKALGASATILKLDMRNGDLIDQLGPNLYERWGRIDVFVANAALLGPLSPLGHITASTWDDVININLNANWRMLRTLDPLLQRSDAGRVVFVSSGAASGRNAYWGPCAGCKAGLEALALTCAAEVVNTKVRSNIVNPGAMATAIRAKAFPGEDATALPTPSDVAPMVVELTRPDCTRHDEVVRYRDWTRAARAEQTDASVQPAG